MPKQIYAVLRANGGIKSYIRVESEQTIKWLFLGSAASRRRVHFDNIAHDAKKSRDLAQVARRKMHILQPDRNWKRGLDMPVQKGA